MRWHRIANAIVKEKFAICSQLADSSRKACFPTGMIFFALLHSKHTMNVEGNIALAMLFSMYGVFLSCATAQGSWWADLWLLTTNKVHYMKLRLNSILRTALLATFVAGGVSVSSAETYIVEAGATVEFSDIGSEYDSVDIAEGGTLTGTPTHNITLSGAGEYHFDGNRQALAKVSVSSDWSGVVQLSGNVGGPENFSSLSHDGSFVRLKGVQAWISPGGTVATNLDLLNADDTTSAYTISGTNGNVSHSFSGTLSGAGDITNSRPDTATRTNTFNFTGDVSGWSGNYINKVSGTQTVNFTNLGNATIGAGVTGEAASGTLNVNIGGGVTMLGDLLKKGGAAMNVNINGTGVTIQGDLLNVEGDAAMNVVVAANSTVTFAGEIDVSNLTLQNSSDVTFSGTLNLHAPQTLAGTVKLEGATIKIDTDSLDRFSVKTQGEGAWSDAENSQGFFTSLGSVYYLMNGTVQSESTATFVPSDTTAGVGSISESGEVLFTATTHTASRWVQKTSELVLTDEILGASGIEIQGADTNITISSGAWDASKLEKGGNGSIAKVTVSGSGTTVSLNNDAFSPLVNADSELVIKDGGTVIAEGTDNTTSFFGAGAISIEDDGELRLTERDALGYNNAAGGAVTLQGQAGHTAVLSLDSDHSLTLSKKLELKGYSEVSAIRTGAAFNTFGGEAVPSVIEVSGSNNDIQAKLQLRRTVNINFTGQNSELTIRDLAKEDAQSNWKVGGVRVSRGKLIISAANSAYGTLTIENLSSDFNRTIEVGDNCTLAFNGQNISIGANMDMTFTADATLAVAGGTLTLNKSFTLGKLNNLKFAVGGALVANSNLTHDGVTYSGGARISRSGEADNTLSALSLYDKNYQISGGNASIAGGEDNTKRIVRAAFSNTAVTYTGTGQMTLANQQSMSSLTADGTTATLQIGWMDDVAVNCEATIGSISGFSGVSVLAGSSLSLGAASLSSAIQNNGSLTFTGSITAEGLAVTSSELRPDENTNNFLRRQESLTVVTGTGSVVADNIQVTQGGKSYTLKADGTASLITYDYSTYCLTTGDGKVSDYAFWASQHDSTLTTVEMTSSGTLTVDADLTTLNANTKGGKVNITTGTVQNLVVNADTTVTGLSDPTGVEIAGGATSTLTDGMSTSGISFSGDGGASIENTGEGSLNYGLDAADAKVKADSLTATGSDNVYVANQLEVKNIVNNGTGILSVTGTVDSTGPLESIAANNGDIAISNGVAVQNLTVNEGKTLSVQAAEGASSTITVTKAAEVAGTVSADVTVQGNNGDAPATFTANSGAEVGGNLTVTNTGKLAIGSGATNDAALNVAGILTLAAASTLDFSDLGITQQAGEQTFTIASAESFAIGGGITVEGLMGFSWTLMSSDGAINLSSSGSVGSDTESPAMFSMRRAAAATDTPANTLTLTILGLTEKPTQLTATEVVTYDSGSSTLNINVAEAEALASLVGKNQDLSVSVGSEAWAAIVAEMNGEVYQNATITLNGESLGQFGTVSFNGYSGTGTKGEYFVAYIPEPATATLSLLALAALAARRRRK